MSLVEFTKAQGYLNIILSNEKQRNCLSPKLMNSFKEIVRSQIDSECRFVVIQARGAHFCAGADLDWMRKQKESTMLENYNDSHQLQSFFEALYNIPVPVIAYVQGGVYGGGVGVVAACDYIIAEAEASFCLSEVKLGLVPAVISPFVINKIGMSWFTALSLSANVVKTSLAYNVGLIHQVAEDVLLKASLEERSEIIAKPFLVLSPAAVRENKKLIRKISDPQVLNKEIQFGNRTTITKLRSSAEGLEGMSALLEKRSPSWAIKV